MGGPPQQQQQHRCDSIRPIRLTVALGLKRKKRREKKAQKSISIDSEFYVMLAGIKRSFCGGEWKPDKICVCLRSMRHLHGGTNALLWLRLLWTQDKQPHPGGGGGGGVCLYVCAARAKAMNTVWSGFRFDESKLFSKRNKHMDSLTPLPKPPVTTVSPVLFFSSADFATAKYKSHTKSDQ